MSGVLAALGVYTLLVVAFLYRLLPVWSTHIPGGLQDTRFLLWNDWWFKFALDTLRTNPFHTDLLYQPFGTSLVLTDSPLWNSLVTYTAQHLGANLVSASNISFMLSWILMGLATFLLAREITDNTPASLVAGLVVMTHSFTLGCTLQNWTRFNLYGIPLFLWLLVRARRSEGEWAPWLWAGVALAWSAACHYYFLVYCLLLTFALAVADHVPFGFQVKRRARPSASGRVGLGHALIAGGLSLWIGVAHPADLQWGSIHIGMKTPYNTLLVMWIGLLLWGVAPWSVTWTSRRAEVKPLSHLKGYAILLGTAGLLLSPLLLALLKMALSGQYPKQTILWKTHRPGANLLSLFMPNETHVLWGPAITRWFNDRGMIVQEQAASIGWVMIAVLALSRPWTLGRRAWRWLALAIGATLLAMGSYLHVADHNLWLPMPFYFLRLLPVAGNARVPSHWMAVGSVAWAVLLAMGLVHLSKTRGWSLRWLCAGVGALILFENWPGIPFVPTKPVSPVYQTLRALPAGGVLTVPIYVGDSSIGAGDSINNQFVFPWDHLWAQITHQKPILGGYIGRIPRTMIEKYKADPFILRLLDLEEGKTHDASPEPGFGTYAYRSLQFQYVLVYPASTAPDALAYALNSLPLELITQDPDIQLYKIKG